MVNNPLRSFVCTLFLLGCFLSNAAQEKKQRRKITIETGATKNKVQLAPSFIPSHKIPNNSLGVPQESNECVCDLAPVNQMPFLEYPSYYPDIATPPHVFYPDPQWYLPGGAQNIVVSAESPFTYDISVAQDRYAKNKKKSAYTISRKNLHNEKHMEKVLQKESEFKKVVEEQQAREKMLEEQKKLQAQKEAFKKEVDRQAKKAEGQKMRAEKEHQEKQRREQAALKEKQAQEEALIKKKSEEDQSKKMLEKKAQAKENRLKEQKAYYQALDELCANPTSSTLTVFKKRYKNHLKRNTHDERVGLIMYGVQKKLKYSYDMLPLIGLCKQESQSIYAYLNEAGLVRWQLDCISTLFHELRSALNREKDFFVLDSILHEANFLKKAAVQMQEAGIKIVQTTTIKTFWNTLENHFKKSISSATPGETLCRFATSMHRIASHSALADSGLPLFFKKKLLPLIATSLRVPGYESIYIEALINEDKTTCLEDILKEEGANTFLKCCARLGLMRLCFNKATMPRDELKRHAEKIELHRKELGESEEGPIILQLKDWFMGQILLLEGSYDEARQSFLKVLSASLDPMWHGGRVKALLRKKMLSMYQTALIAQRNKSGPYEFIPSDIEWLSIAYRLLKDEAGLARDHLHQLNHYDSCIFALMTDAKAKRKDYSCINAYLIKLESIKDNRNKDFDDQAIEYIEKLIERDDASLSLWFYALPFAAGNYIDRFLDLFFEKKLFKLSYMDADLLAAMDTTYWKTINQLLENYKAHPHRAQAARFILRGMKIWGESSQKNAGASESLFTLFEEFEQFEQKALKSSADEKVKKMCDYTRSLFARFASAMGNILPFEHLLKNNYYEFAIKQGFLPAVHSKYEYEVIKRKKAAKEFTLGEMQALTKSVASKLLQGKRLEDAFPDGLIAAFSKVDFTAHRISALVEAVVSQPYEGVKLYMAGKEAYVNEWIRFLQVLREFPHDAKAVCSFLDAQYLQQKEYTLLEKGKDQEYKIIGAFSRLLFGIHPSKNTRFDNDALQAYTDCYYGKDNQREIFVKKSDDFHWVFMQHLLGDLIELIKSDNADILYRELLEKIYASLQYQEQHASGVSKVMIVNSRSQLHKAFRIPWYSNYSTDLWKQASALITKKLQKSVNNTPKKPLKKKK
jgi:hypothetical protein